MVRLVLISSVAVAACAPSPGEAFRPVMAGARERLGVRVEWRERGRGPEVGELLADGMTLGDAVAIALRRNERLMAAFETLQVARAGVMAAFPNPELDLEVRFPVGDEAGRAVELSLVVDVVELLFPRTSGGETHADLDAARAEALGQVVDLVAGVKRAFVEARAGAAVLELRRTIREAAEASFELAARLEKAGNITDRELLLEQALYEQARLDEATAALAAAESRERLNALLGLGRGELGWRFAEDLPALPAEEASTQGLEEEAVARSLALEVARQRIRGADAAARRAVLRGVLPGVAVGAAAEWEEGGWNLGPAVSVTLPLLDWGQGAVARARARERRHRRLLAAMEAEVRAAARAGARRLAVARERVVLLRDTLVPLRERILSETLLQYNAMQVGPFELLLARRALDDTRRLYVEALRDYWRARIDVEQLGAGRLPPDAPRPDAGAAPEPMPLPATVDPD